MEKIQDMVISVAEKEGWTVTIEEQNELRITFLNITRTTTPTMKHIYGLVLTDTDRMVRHTTLRILWRI